MNEKVQPSTRLQWIRAVIRQCSPAAIRVACEIESRWNDDRGCSYPSVGSLAHDCMMSERSVQNGVQELHRLGFMEVFRPDNQGRNMANEYVPDWRMSRLGRVQESAPIYERRVQNFSKKGANSCAERVQESAPQQGISKNKDIEQGVEGGAEADSQDPFSTTTSGEETTKQEQTEGKKTPPVPLTPQDLMSALGYALDWFRGNEEGRQEARDTLAGALALYQPDQIQRAVRDEFTARKRKVPLRELLAVLEARTVVVTPPKPVDPQVAKLRKVVMALVATPDGLAEWRKRSGKSDETPETLADACGWATAWVREVLTDHYPEVSL